MKMANISKQKREEFIAKTEALKQKEAIDDTDRLLLNDIINELNEKRYGLVWEQHSEAVDDMMVNNIPVFT
jgi:adenine-specific DNA-methyltransferase